MNHILVIDGSNLIYRNYHVMITSDWLPDTPKQLNLMMMRSINKSIREYPCTGVFCLWDWGRPEYRDELLQSYKEDRGESPELLKESREFLDANLPKLGIVSAGCTTQEADDLAYLLANTVESGTHISNDEDWLGNLREGWGVYRPVSDKYVDWKLMTEWYPEETRRHFLLEKAILGDGSDSIPKVPNVGPANASNFALNIIRGQDFGTSARAQSMRDHLDMVLRNYEVMDTSKVMTDANAWDSLLYYTMLVNTQPSTKDWMEFMGNCETYVSPDEWSQAKTKFNYDSIVKLLTEGKSRHVIPE